MELCKFCGILSTRVCALLLHRLKIMIENSEQQIVAFASSYEKLFEIISHLLLFYFFYASFFVVWPTTMHRTRMQKDMFNAYVALFRSNK